jgi:hypothetical protein
MLSLLMLPLLMLSPEVTLPNTVRAKVTPHNILMLLLVTLSLLKLLLVTLYCTNEFTPSYGVPHKVIPSIVVPLYVVSAEVMYYNVVLTPHNKGRSLQRLYLYKVVPLIVFIYFSSKLALACFF